MYVYIMYMYILYILLGEKTMKTRCKRGRNAWGCALQGGGGGGMAAAFEKPFWKRRAVAPKTLASTAINLQAR